MLLYLGLFVGLLLAVGGFFAAKVIYPRCYGVQETYDIEKEKGRLIAAEFNSWEKEPVSIASTYGYTLHGYYFPIAASNRTLILSHGITYTLFGSVKYMAMFRDLGFNILIYDLRRHGASGGSNTTFGLYEKHDLTRVVDWVLARVGADSLVGTHGESLGAGISLQHAAIDERIAFVIADCGFSDLNRLLTFRLREDYHLPPFPILPLASRISQLLTGMHFAQVSPIRDMPQVKVPILFIHGAQDRYIPPWMAENLFQAQAYAGSRLWLVPEAAHADAYNTDPHGYAREVGAFLSQNHFISSPLTGAR